MKPLWRTILSALLLVISCVMVPLSLAQSWVNTSILDTPKFVKNYQPLATNPDFQEAITTAATDATMHALEDNQVTGTIGKLMDDLNLPNFNTTSIEGQVKEVAQSVVTSSAFPAAWDEIVGEVHSQIVSALANESEDEVTLQVQISPLVELLRANLVDQGVAVAKLIPDIHHEVPLLRLHDLDQIRPTYNLVTSFSWLPALNAALLVAAIAIANRRWFTLGCAGAGVVIACAATFLFSTTNRLLGEVHTLSAAGVQAIWDTTVAPLQRMSANLGIIGVVVLFIGFLVALLRGRANSR